MSENLASADIKGHLILIMAPTGSGKGELVKHIFANFPELTYSVSCTTRQPRPRERNGVNYHFITRAEFQDKIDKGEFLEWAEFGGNLYGTLKSEITSRLRAGEIIMSEIELQGVETLKQIIPSEHLTIIYVDAGGWESLKKRAEKRAPISEEELQLRYERFLIESAWKESADYIIANYDGQLAEAKEQTERVISAIIEKVNHAT